MTGCVRLSVDFFKCLEQTKWWKRWFTSPSSHAMIYRGYSRRKSQKLIQTIIFYWSALRTSRPGLHFYALFRDTPQGHGLMAIWPYMRGFHLNLRSFWKPPYCHRDGYLDEFPEIHPIARHNRPLVPTATRWIAPIVLNSMDRASKPRGPTLCDPGSLTLHPCVCLQCLVPGNCLRKSVTFQILLPQGGSKVKLRETQLQFHF